MPDSLQVRIITPRELKRIAAELRAMNKTLPAKLRADLRKAAQPMVAKAKRNVSVIRVGDADDHEIRRKIASGVRVQVKTTKGANIRIVTSVPEVSMAIIPRGLDNPSKGWRHPVFGNREVWVTQYPKQSSHWFMDAMQSGKAETMLEIKRTIERAKAQIR